ncbi:interferon-induced protein with tetratricopeptide repeats 5 [Alligator sinensis]|uniref:Interferon-induced protein with tetratricopeptide repeats 5 n=1 Tax=Alligator sinensis TaxID=38654 RepID=A0A1U7SBC9_ALLSI|nr:interferon-induced protein with tetratricopeptide repeats 5 [Alligator sinensis]
MSNISKNTLQPILLQLECHFTWTLLKEDVDLDDLEETICDQIEFLTTKSKISNYNLLSYVKHLNGNSEEALQSLQKAEAAAQRNRAGEVHRKSLVTWGNYAWIYYRMNKLQEAQTYVSKVKDSCKELSSTSCYKCQLPEVYCEEGWALLKFGRKYYERAKKCFEKALAEEPENPEFTSGYAIAMYRLEDDLIKGSSLEPLRRAVTLNPNDTFVMSYLALELQDMAQVEEGEMYITKALQKTPDVPYVLRYAAKFYRRKGEVDKSLQFLEKALTFTPTSSFLHHQIGLCYRTKMYQLKRATKQSFKEQVELIRLCIFHFKAAVDKKSKFIYAYTDLANMYAEGKRYQEAEDTFQKVLQMKLTCQEKQQIHYRYGQFLEFHKKSEADAIKHFMEALKIEGDMTRKMCMNALKKLVDKRIQRGSADAAHFGALGFIHQLNGEKSEAIECYEKALARDSSNEEYLSALCDLRLSIGN